MPRPITITADDLTRWDANFRYLLTTKEGMGMEIFSKQPLLEVWYAGLWLGEQLKTLGASEQEVEDVCFATGQRQAFRPDPWVYSLEAVEKFKKGISDKPGPDLAEQLFKEYKESK